MKKKHLKSGASSVFVAGLASLLLFNASGFANTLPADSPREITETRQFLKTVSSHILTQEAFEALWQKRFGSSDFGAAPPETHTGLFKHTIQQPSSQHGFENTAYKPVSLQSAMISRTLEGSVQALQYGLGIGDVLSIMVLGEPQLSQTEITVSPSGSIQMPLIGTVELLEKGVAELETELTTRYRYYLKQPAITVVLKKLRPQMAYVFGAVSNPGVQRQAWTEANSEPLRTRMLPEKETDFHLSSVLANAGGLLAEADLEHLKIFNEAQGSLKNINLLAFLAYGEVEQDLKLGPQDSVYVPRLPDNYRHTPETLKLMASSNMGQHEYPVRVYGLVKKPDIYMLPAAQMTLHSVLAKAGLDSNEADLRHITVARTLPDDAMHTVDVNAARKDLALCPYDVVIVGRYRPMSYIRLLTNPIAQSTQSGSNLRFIFKPGISQ